MLAGRAIVWSSSDRAVATVNAATGAVTAVAPGTANIIATSEGITGQATLTVTPVPVASVTVILAASSIIAGTSTTAAAETRDASNNVLAGRAIVWSSSDPAVATVDAATGAVTAVAPGTASIIATSEGIAGQASLTVNPRAGRIGHRNTVTSSIIAGTATTASAVARDAATTSSRVAHRVELE